MEVQSISPHIITTARAAIFYSSMCVVFLSFIQNLTKGPETSTVQQTGPLSERTLPNYR